MNKLPLEIEDEIWKLYWMDIYTTNCIQFLKNETYKIKYDTLLIYVKKLQNQQKSYENKVKELKYECEYALHAFDIVSAEYEMLKKENEFSNSLVETNENFSNKIIELVKENRKLKDEKQDLLNQLVIDASSVYVKLCFAGMFLVVVIILLIITQKALYSPWGRMMRAIRDNEEAAGAMGKNVVKQHLLIFILGSAIVGIAGAMMVTNDGLFTPGSYRPMRYTFVIWVMVIVGGTGNNFGAILGGFVVWFLWVEAAPIALFFINLFTAHLPETNEIRVHLINSAPYFRFLVIGTALLVIMRFRPQGILPEKIIKN